MSIMVDRTGKRYGRLTVLRKNGSARTTSIWRCRCDCGNELDVRATNLNSGTTKSCGCLQRDRTKETWRINHTGERFGRLTVVRYLYTDKHKKTIWECRCDCGNVARIHGASLRGGITTSCGCVHKEITSKMLTTHGLSKTKQYSSFHATKRRIQKRTMSDGTVTLRYIEELLTQPCSYCWSTDDIQIDHVEPLSRGGLHSIDNIVPACQKCNASKKDTPLIIWLAKQNNNQLKISKEN